MDGIDVLLNDLAAWSADAAGFHGDRQLADRVLLATGWSCISDPKHPAGVKWQFGSNPVYTAWEPHHPHPIQSLDAALGQFPFGWHVHSMTQLNPGWDWKVAAICKDVSVSGAHKDLKLAVSIAAVKAWELGGS